MQIWQTRLLTFEDLENLPNGGKFELIDGVLVGWPLVERTSDEIWVLARDRLAARLAQRDAVNVARIDVGLTFTPPSATQPAWVVDIVSAHDAAEDVQARVLRRFDAGVQLVWVVHPRQQTVTVYTPDGAARVLRTTDTLDGGDVLPDFELSLAELFGD
jgi:hypothetical protein